VQKKLGEAQNVVEAAGVRRRAIDRKLRDVEALPESGSQDIVALAATELLDEDGVVGTVDDEAA
jgi:DNA recombination protein RmuC